jgi:hypothetical protein
MTKKRKKQQEGVKAFSHIDEYIYEILLREDMFDDVASSTERWSKFDRIIEQVRDSVKESLQKSFDEIFGEDTIVVM